MTRNFSSWNLPPALWGRRTEDELISRHVDLALLRDQNGKICLITFGTSLDARTVRQKSQPLRLPAAAARETRANITENVGVYQLHLTRARTKELNMCHHGISQCLFIGQSFISSCWQTFVQPQKPNLFCLCLAHRITFPAELSFTRPCFSRHCICNVGEGLLDGRMVTGKSVIRPVPQLELRFWNREMSSRK